MAQTFNPPTFNAGEPLSVDKLNQLITSVTTAYTTAAGLQDSTTGQRTVVSGNIISGFADIGTKGGRSEAAVPLDPSFEGNEPYYVFSLYSPVLASGQYASISYDSSSKKVYVTSNLGLSGIKVTYIGFVKI